MSEEYISLLSEQLNILMVCAYLKIAEDMETPGEPNTVSFLS